MDNGSLISVNDNTQQFNRYTKRILTSRILIFILAAICLFMSGIGFILEGLEPHHPGEREDAIVLLILFGSMSLIYLVSGIMSIRKPFTSFIFAAFFTILFLILFIDFSLAGLAYTSNAEIAAFFTILFLILFIDFSLAGLAYTSNAEISVYCITAILILAFIFFIIRGAIFARKHKNLMLISS